MSQLVKCLLYMYEELSLDPNTHIKARYKEPVSNPSTRELGKTAKPGAHWPASLVSQ